MVNKHHEVVRNTFQTTCSTDGSLLYLAKVRVFEEYENRSITDEHGRTMKRVLISTSSTILDYHVLQRTTQREVKTYRNNPDAVGLLFKESGILYLAKFDDIDAMGNIYFFIRNATHLCAMNCTGVCPRDPYSPICEKIMNTHCNHLEDYDFIVNGYEIFGPFQSIFFVSDCNHYAYRGSHMKK